MRRPAVFFDRDNTLIIGNEYLGDPAQVKLVDGAPAAVARCRAMGFAVVVVSNQSGVARGMFGEDEVRACNARTEELLLEGDPTAVIDRQEYCPFHPDGTVEAYRQDSFLRKPKPGMILQAAEAMALDLGRSWMIGDAPRDVAAGKAAGCRTILIVDPALPPSPAAAETGLGQADFTVASLSDAVAVIVKEVEGRSQAMAVELPSDPSPSVPSVTPEEPIEPPIAPAPPAPVPAPEVVISRIESVSPPVDLSRLELLNQQILIELKKANEASQEDFSVSKLIAGITQVLALAALLFAYGLYRQNMQVLQSWLLVAIFLQTFTVALLIMSRQR